MSAPKLAVFVASALVLSKVCDRRQTSIWKSHQEGALPEVRSNVCSF